MKNIAYVTCQELPGLTKSDRLTIPLLAEKGIHVQSVLWDSPSVRWQDFDAVVIRSTWDYHHRYAEFVEWLDTLSGIKVFNPVEVLKWNADKTYLQDLAARGIEIVPTVWLERDADIKAILQEKGWEKAVIKPTISATAYGTWVTTLAAEHQRDIQQYAVPMMLQPFVSQVTTEGEWSIIFFGGKFSHAVLKKPKSGDFRVQSDFGGLTESLVPPDEFIAQAQQIVESIDSPLLYARVDGVNVNGRFQLMELELIEPDLFFDYHLQAIQNFVSALLDLLG